MLARRVGGGQRRRLDRGCRHQQQVMRRERGVVRRRKPTRQVHCSPIVAASMLLADVGAKPGQQFRGLGEFIGARPPTAMEVHQAGHIEVATTDAIAVAPHHGLCQTLDADWHPYRLTNRVHWNRDLVELRPKIGETRVRRADLGVQTATIGRVEALGDLTSTRPPPLSNATHRVL
jgi:hypothetical protein